MTLRAYMLRIWGFVRGCNIFMLIIMWRTLSYSTNQIMQFPKGEHAGRGNAGKSLIQPKISAFTFLSSVFFLVYNRYYYVAISKYFQTSIYCSQMLICYQLDIKSGQKFRRSIACTLQTLVDLFLIGLGLGDSHPMILSPLSFVLSTFVISFLHCFLFSFVFPL